MHRGLACYWLSHFYTSCYVSEILEAVPVSKVLFGSDAWDIPEMNWLAGR